MTYQPITQKLVSLLNSNPALKDAIITSLSIANYKDLKDLDQFLQYLDQILTHIPNEKELMPSVREFYFVLSKSPNDILKKDKGFNDWINEFVKVRGNFLDTAESVETLESYIQCADYKIDDYIKGPSGWMSYNQFLARQMKPGKRQVASLCDDRVIVSPADSEFKGVWPIEKDSTLTVKGVTYKIADLLPESTYWSKFEGGNFTHSFLSITDYHRFHAPIGGKVKEVKVIPANTWVNEEMKTDGSLENVDNVGFQFEHTRGYIILDTIIGYVVVMPVGMGHISSVNLTVEEGIDLAKGEEFGFFGFGGSDIIMIFQSHKVKLFAEIGKYYKQGEHIGDAVFT